MNLFSKFNPLCFGAAYLARPKALAQLRSNANDAQCVLATPLPITDTRARLGQAGLELSYYLCASDTSAWYGGRSMAILHGDISHAHCPPHALYVPQFFWK